MLLFHGTTLENAKKIIKEGFSYKKQNWNCSEEETYFFTEDFFWKESGAECFSDMWNTAIETTSNQARLGLAIENPKTYKWAILVFDTDLMNNGDDVHEDYSCPNMSDMAVAVRNPDMQGLVAVVYSKVDEKSTRLAMLASVKDNLYFEMPELTSAESIMVNCLSESSNLYEIFDELQGNLEYKTTFINSKTKTLLTKDYSREEVKEAA